MEPKKKPGVFVATLLGSKGEFGGDRGAPSDDDEDDDALSTSHEMAYESLVASVGDKQASAIRDYVKACMGEGGSYGKE